MAEPVKFRSATMEPPVELSAFLTLLDAQLVCYRQLQSLVERQSRLVSTGDIARLLGVLAERQKVTQKVSDLTRSILPWRTQWPETSRRFSSAERRKAEILLKEIGEVAQAIVRQDESDSSLLRARKSSVAQSLQGLQAGSRVAHAYAGVGDSRSSRDYAE